MEHHVQLSNSCCLLCRNRVCPSENAFAVLGKDVDYRGHTECFKFPTHGHRVQRVTALYDGEQKHWRLCRYGPCPACRQSPCAFVVHSDCIKIFQTRMPKIRFSQIWHLGLWLNPIPGARYYVSEYNTPRFLIGDTTYPETKELRSWLRGVNTLPQEIINVVLANSETPLISRFAFVLGWQPENLRKLEAQAAKSILPQAISSWFREHFGQEAPLHPRFFMIGLGSLGIRSFQLLESRPTISSTQFLGCTWYIVDKLSRLDDYIIRTNEQFIRLDQVRPSINTLMLWDIATPPDLDQCTIVDNGASKRTRMRCIPIEQCLGISVFCTGRRIYGIYAHKTKGSSAANTYKSLCLYQKQPLVWIYYPFMANEVIHRAWIRRRQGPGRITDVALMIRTTLGRSYIFGPCFNPETDVSDVVSLSKGHISYLIHEDTDDGEPILYFRAYSETLSDAVESEPPEILQHPPSMHAEWDLFHSCASLENVEQVCLFFDQRGSDPDKCCVGILFTYSSGWQEALGQCRMGVSQTAKVEHPSALHWKEVNLADGISGVMVHVTSADMAIDVPDQDQWQSTRMIGMVTWWFNCGTTILSIEAEDI